MKLPLPSDYFCPPPLSSHETDMYLTQAYECAMNVINKIQLANDHVEWSLHSDDGKLKIFKGHDIERTNTKYCLATTEIEGSLEEVAVLFSTDTPEQVRAYAERFGKGLLDAAPLYTLLPRSEKAPLEKVGIHWTAIESPVGKLTSHRDLCLLECQHEVVASGVRGWVRVVRSVELQCCPDLRHPLGLVRMHIQGTGHVFLESIDRPGRIQVYYLIQTEVIGKTIDWALDIGMKRRCKSLLDINQFLRENRLSRGVFLPSELLMPKQNRRNCFLCKKKLWPFSSKFNCLKCGEVLCTWCCRLWSVHVDGEWTQIRACTPCARENRDFRRPTKTRFRADESASDSAIPIRSAPLNSLQEGTSTESSGEEIPETVPSPIPWYKHT